MPPHLGRSTVPKGLRRDIYNVVTCHLYQEGKGDPQLSCLQRLSTPSETWTARTATTKSAPGIETQRTRSAHHTIIPTGKDVRAVDDLLPQAQSCPLMLMLHASNQQSLCSCFAWIRNRMLRSGEMTTSCPRSCTNKKRASTSAVETADNGEGADNADGGMQVLLRMTNWTLAS